MRTTRASAAIDRLKKRSGNDNYSMAMSSNGLFSLILSDVKKSETTGDQTSANQSNADKKIVASNKPNRLCEPMPMDDFVAFVNAYGPQTPKRVSKLDVAFNAQLTRSRNQQ